MKCSNLTTLQRVVLKRSYQTDEYDVFVKKCESIQLTPEQVLEELGITPSSSQELVQSDGKNGDVKNDSVGGYSDISLYYDYAELKEASVSFKNWLIDAILISSKGNNISFRNLSRVDTNIMSLKIDMLNTLAGMLGVDGIHPEDSISEKNVKARDILATCYGRIKISETSNPELLNMYVFLKHFDTILEDQMSFISFKHGLKDSTDILIPNKYRYSGATTEHYTGFSTNEYASAEDMTSSFAKILLGALPQIDSNGNVIDGKWTNFNSIMTCFAQLHMWIDEKRRAGEFSDKLEKLLNEGVNMDLSKLISAYLADMSHAPIMINHFNTLSKLIYAKNQGDYVVQEEFRHIITNMFNKFIHTGYLQYTEEDNIMVAQPLIQRLAMLERYQFEEALVGGTISVAYDSTDYDAVEKEVNPGKVDIDKLSHTAVRDLIQVITGYHFDDQQAEELEIPLKVMLRHFEAWRTRLTEHPNFENAVKGYVKNTGLRTVHGYLTDIAKVLMKNSSSEARSVIKNADGNNLPLHQLPSLVYRAKDLHTRAGEIGLSGFPHISENIANIHNPVIQTTVTVNDVNYPVSKLTSEGATTVAVEFNFLNQLLLEKTKKDVSEGRFIYLQPDCFADKASIFAFPFNVNANWTVGGKKINIQERLKTILETGDDLELKNYIFEIYSSYYASRMQSLLDDYNTVFSEGDSDFVTLDNYEEKIEKKLSELGIYGFSKAFSDKSLECVEDVHYSNKGRSINKDFKLLYEIFSDKEKCFAYLDSQHEMAKQTFMGELSEGHYSGAWEHVRENKLLVKFFKSKGVEIGTHNSRFAKPDTMGNSMDMMDEFMIEDFMEDEYEEGYAQEESTVVVEIVPDRFADNVVRSYMYADLFFAKPINNFLVGDMYAHKGGSIASRYIAQTKRQSIQGATVHTYAQNLHYGVPEHIKIACIEDLTAWASNILGSVKKVDVNDGSGYTSPIFSRMVNKSLLDAAVGSTKKTTFGDINPNTGTATYLKWAEFEITNKLMRLQGSDLSAYKLFRKMHNQELDYTDKTKMYVTKEKALYYKDINSGNLYRIYNIYVNGKNKTISFGRDMFVEGTWTPVNDTISYTSIADIFDILGGPWCYEMDPSINDYIPSEQNLDILHQIVCDFDWKNNFISVATNKSGLKVGVANINPQSSWKDDTPLMTFEMSTKFGGAMMNADHDLDSSESTEPTQMISALVEKGVSLDKARKVYEDISELIDNTMKEFKTVVTDPDDEKLIKKASDMVVRSLERKSSSYGLAGSFVQAYLKNNNFKIPFGSLSINNVFRSEVLSWITKNAIKRKYGGVAAVLNPSYDMVQTHLINGQSYLYDELVFAPEFRTHFNDGWTCDSLLRNVVIEHNGEIKRNPFLKEVTHSSPIDFEDTVVIENSAVVNDLGSGYYIDQYGNETTAQFEVLKIDTFEKYIQYRHRSDLKIYNWTIRPHNLKAVDIQYTYVSENGDSILRSANEKDINVALWVLKNKMGDKWDPSKLESAIYEIYGADNALYEDKRNYLIELANKRISRIEDYYKKITDTSEFKKLKSGSDKKDLVQKRLIEILKTELKNPIQEYTLDSKVYSFVSRQTIPAQIVMGRVYAKEFGLNFADSVNSIRSGGVDFWKNRLKQKYIYKDVSGSEVADFVLYDTTGKRIFIKFKDASHPLSDDILQASESEHFDIIQDKVYYKGNLLLEHPSKIVSRQVVMPGNAVEDVLIIEDMSVLDELLKTDFNKVFYNFTDFNFDVVFNKRYSFDKIHQHSLWVDGEKMDTKVTQGDLQRTGSDKTLFVELLRNSELSRFEYSLNKSAEQIARNFEDSLTFIGTRIPCQSMQSFMPCKICNFVNTKVNEVYVPKHLSWIQGSDFDIDKLYLMGYTPNEDGTLSFKKSARSSYTTTSRVIKNKIMKSIWEITTDPENVVSGSTEVNVDTVKGLAEKSELNEIQKSFSPYNPFVKFIMQNENSVGKDCIGVSAVGNKGFNTSTLYYNEVLQAVAEHCKKGMALYSAYQAMADLINGDQNKKLAYYNEAVEAFTAAYTLLGQLRGGVSRKTTLANLNYKLFDGIIIPDLGVEDSTKHVAELKEILTLFKRNELNNPDVSLAIGELLNAAADNAKELILKKINADVDFMDLYIVGLMRGYSLKQIYNCFNTPVIKSLIKKSSRNPLINYKGISKKSMISALKPVLENKENTSETKKTKDAATMFKTLVESAEELSVLGKLTKINQGLPSNRHFDNYNYVEKLNLEIKRLEKNKTDDLGEFNIFQFVLDEEYKQKWIAALEYSKTFMNPLAIIANHPVFMSMWKAYALGDAFIQRSNSYDRAIKLLNTKITREYTVENNYKKLVAAPKVAYLTKKEEFDKALLKAWLIESNIGYISPNGESKGITSVDFNSIIKEFKTLMDFHIIPSLKKMYPHNKFLQKLVHKLGRTNFSEDRTILWAPKINMTRINEDATATKEYSEMLSAFDELERVSLNQIVGEHGKMTAANALYIYNVICNKSNSRTSLTQFYEDSVKNSISGNYAIEHAMWISSKTEEELLQYYSGGGNTTMIESTFNHLMSAIYQSKSGDYSRISNSDILERLANSSFVVTYDSNNIASTLQSYNMTQEEIMTIANSGVKAFVWNGLIFINTETATESSLTHEFAHILIGNLKTNSSGRNTLKTLVQEMLNTDEGKQLYTNLKIDIPVYAILSGMDYAEEVLCWYIESHPEILRELSSEINNIERKVFEMLNEEDPALSEFFEKKVFKMETLQKIRTVRDSLVDDGKITKNCE